MITLGAIKRRRRSSIGSAWRPNNLGSNLNTWFDADDAGTITLNGSTVSQWNDKSANARHMSQSTASKQPTYTVAGLNGKPVLTLDGVDDAMTTTTTLALPDDYLIAAVVNLSVAGSYAQIYGTRGSGAGVNAFELRGVGSSGKPSIINGNNNSGAGVLTVPAIPVAATASLVGATSILVGSVRRSTTEWSIRQNGSLRHQIISASGFPPTANLHRTVGARDTTFGYMTGFVAEFIEANVISNIVAERIEGYLAWKWGLQSILDAAHPYKNVPPTT